MTISSTVRKAGPFAGNNAATSFPFGFKVFETSDVALILIDPNGNETTLVLDSDYSIALSADQDSSPGGTILYPKTGTPLATNYQLIALGDLPNDQPTFITNSGGFYPEVVMNMSDRSTIQIQQLAEIVSRSIVVAPADTSTPTLPPGAERANMILGFDASGNLTLLPLTASVGAGDMRVDTFISDVLPNPTGLPTFTAGTSTQVVLSRAPGSVFNAWFFFDTGYQGPDQVSSIVGKITTFTGAIPVGVQRVYAITGTTLSIYSPSAGSVIDASVAAGSKLFNRSNDELSLMDFPGADPTGLNDSLAAFNAAAAVSTTLGKAVYVPGGIWKLSAQPTIGTAAFRVASNASFNTVNPDLRRGFWSNVTTGGYGNGANIWRFSDRVLVGTASRYDGSTAPTYPNSIDWIGNTYPVFGTSTGAFEYLLTNAMLAVGAEIGQCGITSYARTSDAVTGGGGTITFGAAIVNDNASTPSGTNTWTFYATTVKTANATGNSVGMELDLCNLGATVPIFPNNMFVPGQSVIYGSCAGGELQNTTGVTMGVTSAAYTIASNDVKGNAKFEKGIVFHSNGLLMTGGVGTAIAMGIGHRLAWYDNGNFTMNAILSTATSGAAGNGQSIQFSNFGLLITDSGANPQFRVNNGIANSANYLMAQSAVAGSPAALMAEGTDTDIVLALTPKGLGTLQFGTYTAGVLTGTGYVTIRTADGVIRRVLIG